MEDQSPIIDGSRVSPSLNTFIANLQPKVVDAQATFSSAASKFEEQGDDDFKVVKRKRPRNNKKKSAPTSPVQSSVAVQMVIDPRPIPTYVPEDLSNDAKKIYRIVQEEHKFGGCTARKMFCILRDRKILTDDGNNYQLEDIGDILHDELKVRKLVYKHGDLGGKWRLLIKDPS